MNLLDLFDLSFVGRREQIALEYGAGDTKPTTYTFGDLDRRSNRMAGLFASRGHKAGDRLCIYLANCLEIVDIYLACLKLGVILVPINITLSGARDRPYPRRLGPPRRNRRRFGPVA